MEIKKLNLSDFVEIKLSSHKNIYGGQSTDIPPGGCVCATPSGQKDIDGNGKNDCYESDSEVYDGGGAVAGGEYHNVRWG